jgi:putative hydrolase of HD superfamily
MRRIPIRRGKTAMNDHALDAGLAFIREAEQLKDVLRIAYTTGGRQESTPEHSWRLCLMAMVFRPEFGDIDFARLLELCVIHDLGEAIHGDTPATADHDPAEKSARERADLQTLMAPLGEERRRHFLELWDEYEAGSSLEAQLVKGLDKLETIIQHNQGANPADFDYAFNLDYGRDHTTRHPLLNALRERVDAATREHVSSTDGIERSA